MIQNLGIPLHNIGMSLVYSPDGFGWATLPMKSKDGKAPREGQFPKGAITEFTFATDSFSRGDDGMLKLVTDLKAQRVRLVLHSDGFEMWSYRLHDRLWWIKRRWNCFAFWFTEKMHYNVKTPHGTNGVKYRFKLPQLEYTGYHLLHFASEVRHSPVRTPPPELFPTHRPNGLH